MSHPFHCPRCSHHLNQTSRNLDFFCRSCYTSVVIIDQEWAEVMGMNDPGTTRVRVETFSRRRHTEPLVLATPTAPLDALAC